MSVCGKVSYSTEKQYFLDYVLLYSTHKIQKGVPLPRNDFRNLQNFKNGRPYIAQNFKISKTKKNKKFPDLMRRISENIRGNFLELGT